MQRSKAFLALVALPLLGSASACKARRPDASDVKVAGGVDLGTEGTKGVYVKLEIRKKREGTQLGTCTGTILTKKLILTAAHCLVGDDGQAVPPYSVSSKTHFFAVDGVHVHPDYLAAGGKWSAKQAAVDVAYLDVSLAVDLEDKGEREELMKSLIPLGARAPAKDSLVTIIGYGLITKGGESVATPRMGRNAVEKVGDTLEFSSKKAVQSQGDVDSLAKSTDALALPGDSGGPMLFESALVGVGSGGGAAGVFTSPTSIYTNLLSPRVEAFMRPLREAQATFLREMATLAEAETGS